MLVTEDEIHQGILNVKDPEKHCFWFYRIIDDIKDNIDGDSVAKRFIDLSNKKLDEDANKCIQRLKSVKIPNVLKNNISSYHVKWKANVGIDKDVEHKTYLSTFCDDVYTKLEDMIEK